MRFRDRGLVGEGREGATGLNVERRVPEWLIEEFAGFEVIIHDGLSDSGSYVVVDTHAHDWQWGRDTRTSFVDLATHMVDLMYYCATVGVDEFCFLIGSDARIDKCEVPRLSSLIGRFGPLIRCPWSSRIGSARYP